MNENKKIDILDSTLRDGAQGEGISFSIQDKIHIVEALDELGVKYVEAGNPGSNPKDMEFFQQVKTGVFIMINAKLKEMVDDHHKPKGSPGKQHAIAHIALGQVFAQQAHRYAAYQKHNSVKTEIGIGAYVAQSAGQRAEQAADILLFHHGYAYHTGRQQQRFVPPEL